ncbi:MAG: hypothetical protein V4710_08555, partial [Verrucomicrobiota bacterium]
MLPRLRLLFLLLLTLAATLPSAWSQTAGWIWSGGEENPERPLFFRRVFTIESGIRGGQLDLLCKEEATVFLNGKEIGRASGELMSHQIRTGLTGGKNVLAVRVKNAASRAGLIAVLRIEEEYGKSKVIVSDRSWLTSTAEVSGWEKAGFDSKGWTPAA